MAIDVIEPGSFPFSETMKVRFRDTDSQGHLYFANYLVFADEITGFYMDELGFRATQPSKAPSFIFTVNIQCDYIDEITANGIVRGSVGYRRLGRSSADVAFLLQNHETEAVLARGTITQVFVDRDTRKSIAIPEPFRSNIIERQGGWLVE